MVPDGFGRSQTVFSNGAEHWSENPMRITQNSLHLRAAKRVLSPVTACSGCQAPREVTFDRSCASDRTLYVYVFNALDCVSESAYEWA